ncbi:hypothetical protein LP421_33930 (plasmid) [Rhizobium sp. RCAM05350]|nr:hypothetical protein LP421_33930 [Rhizobium sp. RCAM05350]
MGTRFTAETGLRIDASFAGVGVVMKRLEKSEHADVVVLMQPAIAELKGRGLITGACVATIGAVATSLAVKTGYPPTVVRNLDCAQTTEILAAQGTTFVADLPSPFSLSTHYAMAATAGSQSAQAAYRFIVSATNSPPHFLL